MNKDTKTQKSGQIKRLMILRWGRISKFMTALPDSGSMIAAYICGTLKDNILKERDYFLSSWNSENRNYSKNIQELNIKMNQIYEAINVFSNPKVVLLPRLSFPTLQLPPPLKENKEKKIMVLNMLKNIWASY